MRTERIDAVRCQLGEGARWDARGSALYLIDIYGRKVIRYHPEDSSVESWDTGGQVGAMALRQDGGAIVALTNSIVRLDLDTGALDEIAGPLFASDRINVNDGAADRQGRFLFGGCSAGMGDPQPVGGLYRLDPGGAVTELDRGVHQSNGHCFSPDGRTLYCADSFFHTMYAYDYDPATGAVSSKRVFANTEALGGVPDGSTVDAEGTVWMTLFQAGKVAAYAADGTLQRVIEVPVSLPSSAAFGGPALDVLYVTTIDPTAFGWPAEENGGYLYAIEGLGVHGVEDGRFAD
jgi:L-arabinonolactonase